MQVVAMMRGMIRRLSAVFAYIAVPAAAQDAVPPPATVVVAFDRDTISPFIVEGLANKEAGRALEANDPVRIASISKLIMALTALRLVDEGKLVLTRDVSDYLGWKLRSPYHPDAKVQLTDLLSHRAGLSEKAGYIIPFGESLQAKLADPASWRDVGPPGDAAFEYANLGSPVVATVLEAASGERYDRLVERLVFAPLGVKACLNWTLCDAEMQARAVTLYRHTGEIAADGADRLPPACTIPVAEGVAGEIESYVPGTNASVFSPQGGVRIGMIDLAKIGQALAKATSNLYRRDAPDNVRAADRAIFDDYNLGLVLFTLVGAQVEGQEFFGRYAPHFQAIPAPRQKCFDDLFGDGRQRIGHSGEAYGLQSGLWIDPTGGTGFAFFTTQVAPPPGGEDTGGFTGREKALMARAQAMLAASGD